MKSILKYTIITLVLIPNLLRAQNYLDSICWITVVDESLFAQVGESFTSDEPLNTILQNNGVAYYEQALPFAKNQELLPLEGY